MHVSDQSSCHYIVLVCDVCKTRPKRTLFVYLRGLRKLECSCCLSLDLLTTDSQKRSRLLSHNPVTSCALDLQALSGSVAQAFMAPHVVRAPQQRILTDELFDTVLHDVTTVSSLRNPVVVYLAGANLQFQHLHRLTNHFEQTQTRVFALDMSMNRIQTGWSSVNEVVNRLLSWWGIWIWV